MMRSDKKLDKIQMHLNKFQSKYRKTILKKLDAFRQNLFKNSDIIQRENLDRNIIKKLNVKIRQNLEKQLDKNCTSLELVWE